MAQVFPLDSEWSAAGRYEATQETEILLCNPRAVQRAPMRWTITQSPATPTIAVDNAPVVPGGENIDMTLSAGEYLWMAGVPDGFGTIEF